MENKSSNVLKATELNVRITEEYKMLQKHLKTGGIKLANVHTLYFGGNEEQSDEEPCPETTVKILEKAFRDMHQFINDTERFLRLL